jgi:hypothetical protein
VVGGAQGSIPDAYVAGPGEDQTVGQFVEIERFRDHHETCQVKGSNSAVLDLDSTVINKKGSRRLVTCGKP